MKKLTTKEFIEEAKLVHDDKYDYSLVEYKNTRTKIKIICPIHGEFWQRPSDHKKGDGCPKCSKNRKLTTKEFIEKAKEVHGNKYDYSLIEYKRSRDKVKIICPIHGEFFQRPASHLFGKGCQRCYGNEKSNTEEFIEKAIEVHGNKYDYSLVEYKNNITKIKIICPIHGEFIQSPIKHKVGKGCPKCKESYGEKRIRIFLEKNNIYYEYQKTFEECKNKRLLPFDFYLPEYNYLIEFDGKQHFEINEYFGGEEGFKSLKINDNIKNIFTENNIHLFRIPYWQLENIDILLNHLFLALKKPLN